VFTFGEVLKFQSLSKLLDSLEAESLKNRMTSEVEKAQCFYLWRGFEVPEPIQALGLQARELLKNRMTSEVEKAHCFLPQARFQTPSKLLESLEGESLKNRMTSEVEKAQCFYLWRGFEVPEPIQALGLQARELLKNRMTSEVEKAHCFLPQARFQRSSKLLESLEGESLKNRMTSEVEKAQCFYLRRGFEVPETIQALRLPGWGVSGK
jgi:hypothetical protein